MGEDARISIWFFIGSLLTLYGIIIFVVSLPPIFLSAPEPNVVLARLHAGFWWGILLFGLGVMYVYLFWPSKTEGEEPEEQKELSDPED
ncbi:MAG TPA: hypothetical protein VJ991_07460 [Balneolales bacterium]|nr:hypothetical protein [Balneolales bacterium]